MIAILVIEFVELPYPDKFISAIHVYFFAVLSACRAEGSGCFR